MAWTGTAPLVTTTIRNFENRSVAGRWARSAGSRRYHGRGERGSSGDGDANRLLVL